jgi:hypothetical protein
MRVDVQATALLDSIFSESPSAECDRSDGYISDFYCGVYPILFLTSSNISDREF